MPQMEIIGRLCRDYGKEEKLLISYNLFPFGEIEKEAKIIIYGHGYVGKQYIEQIVQTRYCQLLFAVDMNYESIESKYCEIRCPDELVGYKDYDYIVIANSSVVIANEIKENLKLLGVETKKIVYRNCVLENDNPQIFNEIREIKNLSETLNARLQSMNEWNEIKRVIHSIDSCTRNMFLGDRAFGTKKYQEYKNLKILLRCRKVLGAEVEFCRVGKENDGGYCMLNEFEHTKYAYSFGISDDVSWDEDISERGIDVYMYDHTISALPKQNKRFHFKKVGIASGEVDKCESLKTLEELLGENGHLHEEDLILKMDVEGAELGAITITNSDVLNKFSQIVMEIHGLTIGSHYDQIVSMLKKLSITHQIIHVHANNFGNAFYAGDIVFTDAIEVSFLRIKDHEFGEYINNISNDLDQPCWLWRDDVELI